MSLIIEDELFVFRKTDEGNFKNEANNEANIQNRFNYHNELNNRSFETVAIHNYRQETKGNLKFIIPFKKRIFGCLDLWYSAKLDQNGIYLQ